MLPANPTKAQQIIFLVTVPRIALLDPTQSIADKAIMTRLDDIPELLSL